MKYRLTISVIILLVLASCTACTNEASNIPKPQTTQLIQTPIPTITRETQAIINKDYAITKSEVLSFFNGDNEFANKMLQYPATDTNDIEQVIFMIAFSLGARQGHPISFDVFNNYTSKYINKTYADSEFAKFATNEELTGMNGIIVIMDKRVLYITGIGGEDMLIRNVEITGNDSALFYCSRGWSRDEPKTMREASYFVQFGRVNSQLFIRSIWQTDKQQISTMFPKLENFDKCLWKIKILRDPRFAGPSSRWTKGFIFLDSETLSKYKAAYKWTDMPDGWKPSLDTEVLKTKELKWSHSDDFDSFVFSSASFSSVGHLYIDVKNGVLFFDVQK